MGIRWDGSAESEQADEDDPMDRPREWVAVAVVAISVVALILTLWFVTQPG